MSSSRCLALRDCCGQSEAAAWVDVAVEDAVIVVVEVVLTEQRLMVVHPCVRSAQLRRWQEEAAGVDRETGGETKSETRPSRWCVSVTVAAHSRKARKIEKAVK